MLSNIFKYSDDNKTPNDILGGAVDKQLNDQLIESNNVQPQITDKLHSDLNLNQLNLNQLNLNDLRLNNDDLMVSYKNSNFNVYDKSGKYIGFFNSKTISKYLSDIYDTKNEFLKDIDNSTTKIVIKLLIFRMKYTNDYVDIQLYDNYDSGFMGNTDLLILLNNDMAKYIETELYYDLNQVDVHNRIKIEKNIKKFTFMLLNYTVKLISIVLTKTNKVDSAGGTECQALTDDMKKQLMLYSQDAVYRISLFVQDQLNIINKKTISLKQLYTKNIEVKNNLESYINSIDAEQSQLPNNTLPQLPNNMIRKQTNMQAMPNMQFNVPIVKPNVQQQMQPAIQSRPKIKQYFPPMPPVIANDKPITNFDKTEIEQKIEQKIEQQTENNMAESKQTDNKNTNVTAPADDFRSKLHNKNNLFV